MMYLQVGDPAGGHLSKRKLPHKKGSLTTSQYDYGPLSNNNELH